MKGDECMGFWYFLLLFIGLLLIGKTFFFSSVTSKRKRASLGLIGVSCIVFALFMFSPGSDEIIADLLNWD